jgi:hypothetical protein
LAARAADLADYVVQSLCLGDDGQPVDRLPIEPACSHRHLQRAEDRAVYRKHDWPDRLDEPSTLLGYQASDSVLEHRGGRAVVVQTFDFGTGGRTFGAFDAGRGDGGQVLLFVGDWASLAMTEDGGGGVQWFLGEACWSAGRGDDRFLGWLVFRRDVEASAWRDVVAKLNIATRPAACPGRYNDAFTRFRLVLVELPFRIVGGSPPEATLTVALDAIVSEHYGGRDMRAADHLERFYFARGLGLVRWERWANTAIAQPASVFEANRLLASTARCPPLSAQEVAAQGAPAAAWLLVDCRTWTTLVRQVGAWSVRDYRWPALGALGSPD